MFYLRKDTLYFNYARYILIKNLPSKGFAILFFRTFEKNFKHTPL